MSDSTCLCPEKTTPGHDTGRVLVVLKDGHGQYNFETEGCLWDAVVVGEGWYWASDGWQPADLYVFEGGRVVPKDQLRETIKAYEQDRAEREKRRAAERATEPRHRIAGTIGGRAFNFGVDGSGADWWRAELEPFGFTVNAERVR